MIKKVGISLFLVALVAVAGAQDPLGFTTQQYCVIESDGSTTYYVMTYNFATLATPVWSSALTTSTTVGFDMNPDEWIGHFIYEVPLNAYTLARYSFRYDGSSAPRAAEADDLDLALAGNGSGATLAFSPSSSLVSTDVNINTGWIYWYNFGNEGQRWFDLTMDSGPEVTTVPLGDHGQWVGMYLYDQNLGVWEDETMYILRESIY